MRALLGGALTSLRYEPTEKHLRIHLDGELVADTVDGLLVWEPHRLVPTYAVPHADVTAGLESAGRVDDLPGPSPLFPNESRSPCIVAQARCSTWSSVRSDAPRQHSGRTIPTWPAISPLTSACSTGMRKTSRSSPTRTTRSNASTSSPVPGTSASSGRDGCWPSHQGRYWCSKLCCRPGSIYRPPTSSSISSRATRSATAPTKAGRRISRCRTVPRTSRGPIRDPLREAEPIRDHVAFFNERIDIIVDGRRRQRPMTPLSD